MTADQARMPPAKPTSAENPEYRCRACGSADVWYTEHETDGHDDIRYQCAGCLRIWWYEDSDY